MTRSEFRFFHRLRVRWAEVDMQKIVFNAHYLMYFDTAIADYWRAMALPYEEAMLALGHEVDLLLRHGLDELNEREREVVSGRYGLHDREPETLEVLAERLGLTRERIRQIQQEALAKLRRGMSRHGIDRDSIF